MIDKFLVNFINICPNYAPFQTYATLSELCSFPTLVFCMNKSLTRGIVFCKHISSFQKKWYWHFMQNISIEDYLSEKSKTFFWKKNKKNISVCHLKILPNMLIVKLCVSVIPVEKVHKVILTWAFPPLQNGIDISCKISPLKTICLKSQKLFSGKKK